MKSTEEAADYVGNDLSLLAVPPRCRDGHTKVVNQGMAAHLSSKLAIRRTSQQGIRSLKCTPVTGGSLAQLVSRKGSEPDYSGFHHGGTDGLIRAELSYPHTNFDR